MMNSMKVLILTASYGAGHNSAARALEEEFSRQGHEARLEDGLALEPSCSYPQSRAFYQFCVNHAGWLWGLTYDQTDRADWPRLMGLPLFQSTLRALRKLLDNWCPDLVICTYPLFNFMIDELVGQGGIDIAHVAVVTDALEVSRPWVRAKAERIFMTDEYSAKRVKMRYVLPEELLEVSSFPTSARFYPAPQLDTPSRQNLRLLYSAQAPAAQCLAELNALLSAHPQMELTLIAGARYDELERALSRHPKFTQCQLIRRTDKMAELMRSHHLYIGKPGGATMFECYASALPMIVNFALMGQEQGNLELLERDACGCFAKGEHALLAAIERILSHDAKEWKHMRAQMLSLPRRNGASRVCQSCIKLINERV